LDECTGRRRERRLFRGRAATLDSGAVGQTPKLEEGIGADLMLEEESTPLEHRLLVADRRRGE
jgi:hypothetical protein